jgi:hypothetical protein
MVLFLEYTGKIDGALVDMFWAEVDKSKFMTEILTGTAVQ